MAPAYVGRRLVDHTNSRVGPPSSARRRSILELGLKKLFRAPWATAAVRVLPVRLSVPYGFLTRRLKGTGKKTELM